MTMTDEIDVRSLAPPDRHGLIFDRLARLGAGDTLRLVNDHDPKPLAAQLEAQHPGQYRWQPVVTGPEVWEIDIICRAHTVDARPVIAAGGEPFDEIMAAAAAVDEGEVLVVHAPFDPVPLHGVLGAQGFIAVSDQLGPDHWRTTFVRR